MERAGTERAGDAQVARRSLWKKLASGGLPAAVAVAVVVGAAMSAVAKPSVTMRGSPASMVRQHEVAVAEDFTFAETPAAVADLVARERLVRVTGGPDYSLARVSYPFARPEVKAFVEYLSAEYRKGCGEALVVTSLTRPRSEQPGNAHKLSVHPAGMAVDFRISKSSKCQKWFEKALLAMEAKDVLDVTREHTPPHFHVAVFPEAFTAFAARLKPAARPAPSPTVLQPERWPRQQPPAAAPAPPVERTAAPESPEAPQTAGMIIAAGIIGVLALFVVWLMKRARRMI
jgi:hypothetical protein